MNKIATYNFQIIENIENMILKVQLRNVLYIYVELCYFLIPGLQSPLREQ
jgi:DNA polymerase III delta prime subunit